MFYTASWLVGDKIVAEKVFQDLFEAQAYVIEHMPEFHERGATCVKVCDANTIYLAIY